ncbi:MAG: hypothetical protein GZ091_10955 [Paludibacter sp.]|nr:hypothetical protein [Paludibacter sp.]
MDIIKSIQQRKSCRTFTSESLKPSDRKKLEEYINSNKTGIKNEVIDFTLVEKKETDKPMKLTYGLIKGNKTYILGKTASTASARVNYGYLLEKIVLKATDLKLASCWIGMFDKEYFNDIQIENEQIIPGILTVGYSTGKKSTIESLARKAVKADKRKPWDQLFFNYETNAILESEIIKPYIESLEMTRLAPSSGNTQPWRIFYESAANEFHFFKKITNQNYESKGMHDIDMGIAMCHFELVSDKNDLKGNWIKNDASSIKSINDLQYINTWKCL